MKVELTGDEGEGDRCDAILSHYTIPRTPLPRCVLPKGHGGTHERQKRTENGTDEDA